MYKDRDKQREADRERQRRYRRDKKGVTNQGVTQGVTDIKTAFNAGELSQCAEMRGIDDVSVKPKRGWAGNGLKMRKAKDLTVGQIDAAIKQFEREQRE